MQLIDKMNGNLQVERKTIVDGAFSNKDSISPQKSQLIVHNHPEIMAEEEEEPKIVCSNRATEKLSKLWSKGRRPVQQQKIVCSSKARD